MFIADGNANPSLAKRRGLYLHLSKTRVVLIALLILAPWVVILVRSGHAAPCSISVAHEKPPATTSAAQTPAPTGEWGQLEVTPITIEAPADAAIRFAQADTSTWYFPNCTAEKSPPPSKPQA